MLAFLVQRLFQAILVMLVVGMIAFALFQFVGDPINNMVGQDATEEQRELLRNRLGLNDSVPVQFAKFVINAAQGKFGVSYRLGQRVDTIIVKRLPATLELVGVAAILALLIGGNLLGFVGLLVAVPVTAVLQVFLQELVASYRDSGLYRGVS